MVMNEVKIEVPSSSANVGLGYDVWCLGLEKPSLTLTYIRLPKTRSQSVINFEAISQFQPPNGRQLGYAGKVALEEFLKAHNITDGAHLHYEDNGFPVGGLGRSGAEAVGAIMAAAVMYDIKLTRDEVIAASAEAEPGKHKDNVAASTNGRLSIIVPSTPYTGKPSVDYYDLPANLGLALGFSSHQKTGGTEEGRLVLKHPVEVDDFVNQTGMISAATAALVTGSVNRFIELAWGDKFHQPRRADVRFYGNFDKAEFFELQKDLYHTFNVALDVSGAGPNMQFKYNKKDHPNGIITQL